MLSQCYQSLLARAGQWGFDTTKLPHNLRTALAAFLAVLIAWALGLQHPQWAGMTVWAAAQPLRGQMLEKSLFRITGTMIGTVAGVALVLVAHGDILWLVTGLAVWMGICAGLGNLQRGFASYGTMLAGYSAAMVALLDWAHPENVYTLGWDRLFTALTGVFTALLVGWLFTAKGTRIPGDSKIRHLCARLLRDLAQAAIQPDAPQISAKVLAERLSLMGAIEEGLEPHAAGSQRSREAVRALRRLINAQIYAMAWMRDSTNRRSELRLAPEQAKIVSESLEQAAQMLEADTTPGDAVQAIARARAACEGWGSAPEMLANIGYALQAQLVTQAQVPLPDNHRSRQLPVVLHSDLVGARRAMLRAFSAMFLVGMIWVVTGWSGGAYMLLGLSVMITVFSSFDNPVFTMRFVTLGQAFGVLVALGCQWLAWPFAHSQFQMVLMMLPFIMIGGLLFSHRRTMLSGYDCNMVLLLLLSPHYPHVDTFGHSLAMGLAVITGPLAGWAAYRFILPITVQGRLQGLRAMMVHELQDMAAAAVPAHDVRVWRARLYHRLLRLVRNSEKVSSHEAAQAAENALAALRVGHAIQTLHKLADESAVVDGAGRCVRTALKRLERLQAAPLQSVPALRGAAKRLKATRPQQAMQLAQVAVDIEQHQAFFASHT